MTTLERAAVMSFGEYSPALVMDAVEELRPLSKDEALGRVAATAAPSPLDTPGLFWVMRVLFDMPGGEPFPEVALGESDIPPPPDPSTLERFPIVLAGDVPFLVVHGYALAGLPEGIEGHVAAFRERGIVRQNPLVPPESASAIAGEFDSIWRAAYGENAPDVSDLLATQLERLSVSRPS